MLHSNLRALALAQVLAFCLAITGCDGSTAQAPEPDTQAAGASSAASADSTDTAPFGASSSSAADDIKNLSDAIAAARPTMGDTQETFSDGARMLALWASDRIEWKELAAIPSTKPALVLKDSEDELGKRICSSGEVVEISAQEMVDKVYVGELANMDSGNIFRFIALRSTGDLVAQSNARFCGIVTGKVDYANSMGGESHAIQLVGMFDLPENHKPVGAD